MSKPITYVGLDVHKDTIAVALAEAGLRGEVREHGKIPNTPAALKALTVKLAPARKELRFCYEAGPCGYGIQRQLTEAGHECAVVAPSLIPRKPGERIKTDRRDAINLAKLRRAGELTSVWVPGIRPTAKRSVISSVHVRRQCAPCARRDSNCLASCCATAAITTDRPGRSCTGAGWQASSSTRRHTSYCAGRLYRSRRGGDGTARPTGDTYRSRVAGVVSRSGG